MNKRVIKGLLPAFAGVLLGGMLLSAGAAQDVNLMTKETLKKNIANPDTYILDVRTGRDWSSSEFKIEGAHRTDPDQFETWVSTFPKTGTLVLYCA